MTKTYFPGLNTLRLYAALSVVVYHFAAPMDWFRDVSFRGMRTNYGFMWGTHAVSLFFVLSGFLIIYLLLKEKESSGTVATGRFYLRRVFRILPLYYLTILAGALLVVITFPLIPVQTTVTDPKVWAALLFFFFNFTGGKAIPLAHLWSLNVEEQFYALCPQLIKYAHRIPLALILVIVVKVGFQIGMFLLWKLTSESEFRSLMNLSETVPFEYMALGGLGAYLVLHPSPTLKVIIHPIMRKIALVGAAAVAMQSLWWQLGWLPRQDTWRAIVLDMALAGLFFVVIVNIAAAPKFILRVESPLLRKFGDMSYGIYMWHPLVIWVLYFAGMTGIVYQVLTVMLTFAVAYVSHTYFETWFLKLRERISARRAADASVGQGPDPAVSDKPA